MGQSQMCASLGEVGEDEEEEGVFEGREGGERGIWVVRDGGDVVVMVVNVKEGNDGMKLLNIDMPCRESFNVSVSTLLTFVIHLSFMENIADATKLRK